MKQTFFCILSCILLTSLLISPSAFAAKEEAIGTVVAVRGKVTALAGSGVKRGLTLKSPVFKDDTVRTGNGRVQLMFSDNTLISLGRESEMVISEYDWQPEGKSGAMKTRIKEGTFRVMGGAITKVAPGNFSTETPAATIGIRGSMYAGKATPESLTVVFQGGKGIDITNAAGTVAITKPGFGTRVLGLDRPPLPPARFTAEDLNAISEGLQSDADQAGEDSAKEGESDKGDAEAAEGESSEASPDEQGDGSETATNKESEKTDAAAKGNESDSESGGGVVASLEDESGTKSDAAAPSAPNLSSSVSSWGDPGDSPQPPPPTTPSTYYNPPLVNVQSTIRATQTDSKQTETTNATNCVAGNTANCTSSTSSGAVVATGSSESASEPTTETTPAASIVRTLPLWQLQGVYSLDASAEANGYAGTGTLDLYDDGSIRGSLPDGTVLPTMTIPGFDPAATYGGPVSLPSIQSSIQNSLGTFTTTVSLKALQTGQFMYGAFKQDLIVNATSYEVSGLAFAGAASSGLPVSGIESYAGQLAHISQTTGSHPGDGGLEDFYAEINWHNKAVVGRIYDSAEGETEAEANVFFFGHFDTDPSLSRITIIDGHKLYEPSPLSSSLSMEVEAINGNVTFRQLYGSNYEGFGFTAEGDSFSLQTGALLDTWQAIGAGFLEIETDPVAEVFDTGSSPVFEGFVVGIADNMAGPDPSTSRLFMNSLPEEFSFTVNKAAGTLSGTLSAEDWSSSGSILADIMIGGTYDSAYVLDDQFAAILGCSTGDCVQKYVSPDFVTGDLKPYGNFLITAEPGAQWEVTTGIQEQETDYLTWGYWEIAYEDPDGNSAVADADYHLFGERSLWIAGERTPQAAIDALRADNFTGTYTGGAKGVRIDTSGPQSVLGRSNITVAFGSSTVSGSIDFGPNPQDILEIDGTLNAVGGFNSFVGNAAETTAVNGALFGPQAEEIGGNFESWQQIGTDSIKYIGIFGGSRP